MKRTHLSPVTSLVVALSLVVGILVSDLAGTRLLTAAHARSGCAGQGGSVNITQGVLTGGVVLHNIVVNGQLVPEAYVPGSVQVTSGTIPEAEGIIVSDGRPGVGDAGPSDTDGIIVSDGRPIGDGIEAEGIIVSDGGPCITNDGIIVSDGRPGESEGIIVSDGGDVTATGIIVSDGISVMAAGGTLSGDGISVENGVVTGQNLRLTGASISGGSLKFNGVVTSVRVPPTN